MNSRTLYVQVHWLLRLAHTSSPLLDRHHPHWPECDAMLRELQRYLWPPARRGPDKAGRSRKDIKSRFHVTTGPPSANRLFSNIGAPNAQKKQRGSDAHSA